MRPLKLAIEGFTSYRRLAEVDFTDLDLFAITGPTGAGKSSLVDGIAYALYGRVPRLGGEIKELINQGSDRLRVAFEFTIDGQPYRVMRSTARKGLPQVQLRRFDPAKDTWVGEADRSRQVDARLRSLLGLDFEGFTRSVLLPQGRFAEFLAGEPQQRRKVLWDLLRLEVYERVRQQAAELAREAEARASALERRLVEEYADVTPERLRENKKELRGLRQRSEALRQGREVIEGGKAAAQALARAAAEEKETSRELAAAQERWAAAEGALREGEDQIRALDTRIEETEVQIAGAQYDPEVERQLSLALTPAREGEKVAAALEKNRQAERERAEEMRGLLGQREEAQRALTAAEAEASAKEGAYAEMSRRNMAAELRRSLRSGDPCPVCGQAVALLPLAEHVALDEAMQALEAARRSLEGARQAAQKAEQAVAVRERDLEALRSQLWTLEEDRLRWLADLRSLGIGEGMPSAGIEAALGQQMEARQQYESLLQKRDALKAERESLAARYAEAKGQVAGLSAVVNEKEQMLQRVRAAVAQYHHELLAMAEAQDWSDIRSAVMVGGDAFPLLTARLFALEAELRSLDQAIGWVEGEIQRIQKGIEAAKQLRREAKALRQEAGVAKGLADLLRANRFVAWLEEAALAVLAEDASKHLLQVSSGRYEFDAQGQEFLVLDHWNADERRSVRTLSGGETFLASLALALALAQRLPELGPGRRSSALESLFLDEGFGNLDEETLDVVASALESVMNQGKRMVGIITHLRPLAERMPVRINVVKSESGSSIYVD